MRNLCLGLLACVLGSSAALGQEPMPLQVMPNSPAGRAYAPVPTWQAPPVPAMAYSNIYPAVWQFGPNPNAVVPAYQNDVLPNPGMVVGPPLQDPLTLQPLPWSAPRGPGPQTPIVQACAQGSCCGQGSSSASPAPSCAPDPVCCPPVACPPPEPYLVESTPWQPVRVNHCYVMGDYLLWWTDKQLVPQETQVGLPVFTLPDNGPRSGARLTVGSWINPSRTLAVEASGFWLEERSQSAGVIQGPNPNVMQLPFVLGIERQISSVVTDSQLWGAEIDGRYKACEICRSHCKGYVDFLAGFRYVNLTEGLTFDNETLFSVAPVLFSGALVKSSDFVGTQNNFYAPQVGVEAGFCFGRCNVSAYSKIALGVNHESVTLAGNAVVTAPPLPLGNVVAPGGLLVQTPGHFSQEAFSYVPEAGINFSFKICDWCLIGTGYSFLYFGNVVRPADHLPASSALFPVSILPLVGAPAPTPPAFSFNQTNFWAQGANFRITFIF